MKLLQMSLAGGVMILVITVIRALDRAFFHAALDERVGRVHVPSQLLAKRPGDLPGGGIPLLPQNVHDLELRVE